MDNKITFEDLIIYGYQNDNYFFNLKGLFIKNKIVLEYLSEEVFRCP